MKDILIVTHFTQIPGEIGNGRFSYLLNKINKKDIEVEMITSSFSHRTKKQREIFGNELNDIDYKLTMIYEPNYKKNISLKRFYSHYILARNIKKYLKDRKCPDVIYCAVPSLDVAKVMAEYAKINKIKFIIDIQDLWPEAFKMIFNIPILSDAIFYPMKKKANYIYSMADEIIGVSESYVEKVLKINTKCSRGLAVYLGTELSYVDKLLVTKEMLNEKKMDEIWLGYIGTLGHSYDIETVMDSLKILNNKGIKSIKFLVMGDGPLKSKFENYALSLEINAKFTGRIDYEEMIKKLKLCDIAINPIKKNSAGSIINKVGDYAAVGLPILNTQECEEYRELVNKYNCGFNINSGDSVDLAKKMEILYLYKDLRKKMGLNNRKLAEEKFDREKTYCSILNKILQNKRDIE